MAEITVELIQKLRERTGIGMMDCKKALVETDGDIDRAIDLLRKKGTKIAEKRSGLETNNGIIHAYIHPGAQLGVLIDICCETDFAANTDTMKNFAHDICMQIAAARPLCVSSDELNPDLIAKEREIYIQQLRTSGKPEAMLEKIAGEKIKKYYEEVCLLDQTYIKNNSLKIRDYLDDIRAKIGENVRIRRFVRYEVGGTL